MPVSASQDGGIAATIDVDDLTLASLLAVDATLRAIDVDDEVRRPGTGPVAFAALPFAPNRPAAFVVPTSLCGRAADGTRWHTTISGDGVDPGSALGVEPQRQVPTCFEVRATMDPVEWQRLVGEATAAIATGAFDKVVLARELLVTADSDHDVGALLSQLADRFSDCYLCHVGSHVGASPELLVERSGDTVRAQPMAGTARRGGDPTADARLAASLLASAKDRREHQITIDMVLDTLLGFCSYADSEPEPHIAATANVQHLASLVEGRLSTPPASVLDIVAALHPTPAVGGWPVEPALRFIADHEGMDRGSYAGPVGWVDAAGNGTWAVGIRSALVEGPVARLYAGNGMVADSDPALELAETQAKFQAMLSALVRV